MCVIQYDIVLGEQLMGFFPRIITGGLVYALTLNHSPYLESASLYLQDYSLCWIYIGRITREGHTF